MMLGPSTVVLPLALAFGTPVLAQGIPITIGTFTTERSCTTYVLTSGRIGTASRSAAAGVTDGVDAAYASRRDSVTAAVWRQDLVRDCQRNFPGLRGTLSSAFASADAPPEWRGRRLTLTGRLTDVGFQDGSISTGSSSVSGQNMAVSIDFQVRDAAGRVVYGGSLTKRIPLSGSTETADLSVSRNETGRTTYSQLQREVAYAVARAVTFRMVPLRVVANDGRRLALNYGTPIVPLGAAISVPHRNTLRASRLNVTSATQGQAIAESEGDVDVTDVPVGTIVTFAEADSPEANVPVMDRVGLPPH